jgi:hypothetical protein
MPNSSPRSLTDIQLAAATTGRIVTRDSSGIALVTDALTVPILHHRAQPIASGFDGDVALTFSSTRDDGTDPGMDPGSPAPVGNIAFGNRNPARENTPYRWPWYVADDGAMQGGQGWTQSQMRAVDGRILGPYGPGSTDVLPDGNWPCFRGDNTTTTQPNGVILVCIDRDSADVRGYSAGPYNAASGTAKFMLGPKGQQWAGTALIEDPEAHRLAKQWLRPETNNWTFEGSATGTTTTVDIWRPSTAGVGSAKLGLGRRADGLADLVVTALSSATAAATVNFDISTPTAMTTAMSFINRTVDGAASVLVKAPVLGVGSGIKFTTDNGDGTGTARAAFGTAGNLVVGGVNGNYLLTLAGASRGGVYLGIPAATSVADGDIINYANLGGVAFAGTVTGFLYSIDSSAAFTSTFKNSRSSSTAANAIFELATQSANGGSPFNLYTIAGVRNVCVGIDNVDGDKWKVTYGYPIGAGTDAITVDTTGNFTAAGSINAATTFKVAGTQVVGARGAAVADATGAGDVVAQLNALLARLRTHGLIAP